MGLRDQGFRGVDPDVAIPSPVTPPYPVWPQIAVYVLCTKT